MYISLSYSAGCLRFLRGGMTGEIIVLRQRFSQPICIESAVGQHIVSAKPFDQFWHAAQVMGLSGQKAEIGNVSKRVRQRQNLGRHPATRLADGLALSPPFAPCPARWTLTMEPSIMAYSKSGLAAKALNMP